VEPIKEEVDTDVAACPGPDIGRDVGQPEVVVDEAIYGKHSDCDGDIHALGKHRGAEADQAVLEGVVAVLFDEAVDDLDDDDGKNGGREHRVNIDRFHLTANLRVTTNRSRKRFQLTEH